MKILFLGFFIFFVSLFLHILIWRIRIPRSQTKVLFQVFLGVLVVSFLILWNTGKITSTVECFYIALFVLSLAITYISIYSAIEADSPSLVIVTKIAKAGSKGLNKEELLLSLTDDLLVKSRLTDLIGAKMVYLDGDKYKLSLSGVLFIRIFIFYRKLLKAGKGG